MFLNILFTFISAFSLNTRDKSVPTPIPIPISIRVDQMADVTTMQCTTNACPDDRVDSPDFKCGQKCQTTEGTFEYTFKGEKFGIYGTYSPNHHKFNLEIDGMKVGEIDENLGETIDFSLLYVSKDLEYGEHTVKMIGQGETFEIYKLVFWPSLKAKRINVTEFTVEGEWIMESDNIGGLRKYAKAAGGTHDTAIIELRNSKVWLYGSECGWCGKSHIQLNETIKEEINTKIGQGLRKDNVLLYESDPLDADNYIINISTSETLTLNSIFYLSEPSPTPIPIPISIRVDQMADVTTMQCTTNTCPNDRVDSPNFQCGQKCQTTEGTFEYTFKGEKFGIYGTYSPNHHRFNLEIDGEEVEIIDENNKETIDFSLLYVSKDLEYGEHTVKMIGQGETFEIYKLVFWPSLKAKRINVTEFTVEGEWIMESDNIGGLRKYAKAAGGTHDTAIIELRNSKVWLYGSECGWCGKSHIQLNETIKEEINTKIGQGLRKDNVLLYESDPLDADNYIINISTSETLTLNSIFYLSEPSPTPIPIPISIRVDQMADVTTMQCTTNACPNDRVDSPNFQCGTICTTKGTMEYTFTGVKFGIFGSYSPYLGGFDVEIDDSFAEEIDEYDKEEKKYSLLYVSNDLDYGNHKVKIQSKGKRIEIYKLVYWVDFKAKRLNCTEFEKIGQWTTQSDLIGGLREYVNKNDIDDLCSTQLRCSKIWVYGTQCSWHGKFIVSIGDKNFEINEYKPGNKVDRYDHVLLFESEELETKVYTLQFSSIDTVTLNCFYYIEEPIPTPEPIPVSIPVDQMADISTMQCVTNQCPNDRVDAPNYQCGTICKTESGKFEYSFNGVKFGIYGSYSPNFHKFDVEIDGYKADEVNEYRAMDESFVLLYLSTDLDYKKHTVSIKGNGELFEIYKLIYWPSLKAKRINITDFTKKNNWEPQSDGIGGIREYSKKGDGSHDTASVELYCSKIWVYGSLCSWCGSFTISIGDINNKINTFVDKVNSKDVRHDFAVLYESYGFTPDTYTLTLESSETVTFNYVYYLDEPVPTPAPIPTPSLIPISIRVDQMADVTTMQCSDKKCPDDKIDSPDFQCGKKCQTTEGTFEYTFKGEKFGIYGTYSPNHHKFNLEIDGMNVGEIDENLGETIDFSLLYVSEDLEYGEHTVKMIGQGETFEIYKLVFWPSLKAKRINVTEFTVEGEWIMESDNIGGLRKYAKAMGGTHDTARVEFRSSKVWLYGSECSWCGKYTIKIGNYVNEFDSYIEGNGKRNDNIILFESDLAYETYTLSIETSNTLTINCIYYIDEPAPTPMPIPISIGIAQMKHIGEFNCNFNIIDIANATKINCNYENLEDPSAYECGYVCSTKYGTLEYKFKGVKFGIYGTYSPVHYKFDLEVDGVKTEIDENRYKESKYKLLYLSDELEYKEHTIKTIGKGDTYEIYKIVFWPSMKAKRLNATELDSIGNWQIESDGIGGSRKFIENGNGTLSKQLICSKIWLYGTKCSWHGKFNLKFGDNENEINERQSSAREDAVLLYESSLIGYNNYLLSMEVIKQTVTVYCIYYLDDPMPTPLMTPIATEHPMDIIELDDNDCNTSSRCWNEVKDENKRIMVYITVTEFININSTNEGGGAIHMVNSGLECNKTYFERCKAIGNCGGAIYVKNSFDFISDIHLNDLSLNSCEAEFGGAVYIYAISSNHNVLINGCNFTNNQALASLNDKIYGGSACFLTVLNGVSNLIANKFRKNKGFGGSVKIYNKDDSLNGQVLNDEKGLILISNCLFEINYDSDCSLFYLGDKSGSFVELKKSTFIGDLASGSFHINGKLVHKDAPKLVVKDCNFDSNSTSSINLDKNNKFISINLKKQSFKNEKSDNEHWLSFKLKFIITIAGMAVLAATLLVCAIIYLKKDDSINEISDEMHTENDFQI